MIRDELIGGSIGTALGIIGTATQVNDILKTISLVITIIGAIITYIVVPLIVWYKKAKQDGKIDADEIKKGIEIISGGSQSIKDKVEEVKKLDQRDEIKRKEGK